MYCVYLYRDLLRKERRISKMCLFCEAYDGKRQIADRFLTNGQRVDISVAIVERYFTRADRFAGRSLDYINDGKGTPLNYCPTCGKKLSGTAWPK